MISVLAQRALKLGTLSVIKTRSRLFANRLPKPEILYFAYGANLDPKRFEKYEMNAIPVGRAMLEGYALKFTLPCEYLGKGYASIEPQEGKSVWGFLYKVDRVGLALLDVMEYVFLRHYERIAVKVETKEGAVATAWTYKTPFSTSGLVPSTEYKNLILRSAEQHSFPQEYLDELKRTGSREKFELDPGYSLAIPSNRRPFESKLKKFYLWHDKVREILCEKLRF